MVTASIPLESPVRIAATAEVCKWHADRMAAALGVIGDIEDERLLEGDNEQEKRAVVRTALIAQIRTDSERLGANLAELRRP